MNKKKEKGEDSDIIEVKDKKMHTRNIDNGDYLI
jgi:hypothetical protein